MNICVFGASIAWGSYDPENGGWVTLLRNYFQPERIIKVYNCGISANKTSDLLIRLKVELEARKPGVVIFEIGINDSLYVGTRENSRTKINDFKNNLIELVRQAREFTDKIVFVGIGQVDESKVMPIPWGEKNRFWDNKNIEIYNNIIKEVCNNEKLDFIDLKEVIGLEDLYDGLHPNTEGHKKIFETVKMFLKSKDLI
jgi:lysophospholipase L1-like esterase